MNNTDQVTNPLLDGLLSLKRGFNVGGDGIHVSLGLQEKHCYGYDGYACFLIMQAVAHEAAYWACNLNDGDNVVTFQSNGTFLNAAHVDKGTITGKGRVLKNGKRMIIAEGEAYQGDKLLAKVTATFVRL